MKYAFSILTAFIVAFNVQAGGYYSGATVDEYDKDSGLYFMSAKNGHEEGGFLSSGSSDNISDINIFNPATGESALLFGDNNPRKITSFVYESDYHAEKQSIVFGAGGRNYNVKNNYDITERKPKNKLLIVAYNKNQASTDMWSSSKSGEDLKRIKSLGKDVSWHIDVKNSKIRFVSLANNRVKIESLEW